jgi:hypothetical protein
MNIRIALIHALLALPTLLVAQPFRDTASFIKDPIVMVLIQGKLYDAIIVGQDTLPIINLPAVEAVALKSAKQRRAEAKYLKLVAKVKKVLPLAKLAGQRMKMYEAQMAGKSKEDRKRMMKQVEKEIRREFEADVKRMSWSEGQILLKLIDRETGMVSYDLVKHFRGGFTAFMFQGIAKIFSQDLKDEYDPIKDDKIIEGIVQKIERGEL